MIPLIGYADRLSVRPGEKIEFKVSSTGPDPFKASLWRSISADPNPAGLGLLEEAVEADFKESYPSRVQEFYPGSHAHVPVTHEGLSLESFTLLAAIWPTTPDKGAQTIIEVKGGKDRIALMINEAGTAELVFEAQGNPQCLSCPQKLKERRWTFIWASYDAAKRSFYLHQESMGETPPPQVTKRQARWAGLSLPPGSVISVAASQNDADGEPDPQRKQSHFNGKIEAPGLYNRALTREEVRAALRAETPQGALMQLDFSRDIPTTEVRDIGPLGLDGTLFNFPARAMTGWRWSGRETCWRHATAHYGAIHFHDDDIYDFGWESDLSYSPPPNLPSGVYVLRLSCGENEDAIPFFVCPPKGKRSADLAVLVSTFTYSIYGNHARPDFKPSWKEKFQAWNAYPWNPAEHREYGLSTYNYHSDGSGICHASYRRPLFNLRPGYLTFGYGEDSGLRHFQADSHLLSFLHAKRIDYDIITDQELHEEGLSLLKGYRALATGTHPEYHTAETLDALEAYRDQGGKIAYLGGNGFYWRIALHDTAPGIMEIRRAESGIRAWACEPGEYFNAFDGNYGGLWRRNGRPPQRLAGIGFSGQGNFKGSYYRRCDSAATPSAKWIFAGIDDAVLGDFGFSGGGAAGFELDRVDPALGSPEGIEILARSEGHDSSFILVPEEVLTHLTTLSGEAPDDLVRADMSYLETPGGGAVFAVGSITFCGSLPVGNFENNIARLLENVLRRFLES